MVLKKQSIDTGLLLLFGESIGLVLFLSNALLYWLILLCIVGTGIYVLRTSFRLELKKIFSSRESLDFVFLLASIVFFSLNLAVFRNPFMQIFMLALFYLGFRYFFNVLSQQSINQVQKNVLILACTFGIFSGTNFLVNLAAITGKEGSSLLPSAIYGILYIFIVLVSFYNFNRSGVAKKWSTVYSLCLATILTQIVVISSFYIQKYPNFYQSQTLSITMTALFVVVSYYCLFGLMIHKLENKLSFKVIFEYVALSFVIFATLLATVNWGSN